MKKDFMAVLFDFDGVLVDSMEDNFLAWKRAFKEYGVCIEKEDYFPLEGMKLIEIAKTIGNKFDIGEKWYEKIVKLKNKYYLENHSFSFYQGVIELVDSLKEKGTLLAIISASPREKLNKTVPEEFLKKFDTIVSGDDLAKGKPFPDPYLKAIEDLSLSPKNCVVVENSPLGIKSAKTAGIYCIAISSTLNESYLQEADEIISEFKDLNKLLIF